jgi:hypothetical protein
MLNTFASQVPVVYSSHLHPIIHTRFSFSTRPEVPDRSTFAHNLNFFLFIFTGHIFGT